ncbi:hypothetical protein JOD82_002141 [Paenibacillus sp. 1182]|nr:hypothetical protein [Paenibacillus sp. 1182]
MAIIRKKKTLKNIDIKQTLEFLKLDSKVKKQLKS